MFKKTLAAAVVAGALLFTGASAAQAGYNTISSVAAGDTTLEVGGTTTITATVSDDEVTSVTFSVSPTSGAALSSIVRASTGGVAKPVADGVATATFTASAPGTYVVTAAAGDSNGTTTITVAAEGAAAGGDSLVNTGGEFPAAALWIGAGALGLGGLAVVAATARRRAQR